MYTNRGIKRMIDVHDYYGIESVAPNDSTVNPSDLSTKIRSDESLFLKNTRSGFMAVLIDEIMRYVGLVMGDDNEQKLKYIHIVTENIYNHSIKVV